MIIAAFACTGKTTIAKNNKNYIDLESSDYKWIFDESIKNIDKEKRKGAPGRTLNPEWPYNYINKIKELKDVYEYVLIVPDTEVLMHLDFDEINYLVVVPEKDNKKEYIERAKRRENHQVFIDFIDRFYEVLIEVLYVSVDNERIIILEKGKYLEDIKNILENKKDL